MQAQRGLIKEQQETRKKKKTREVKLTGLFLFFSSLEIKVEYGLKKKKRGEQKTQVHLIRCTEDCCPVRVLK